MNRKFMSILVLSIGIILSIQSASAATPNGEASKEKDSIEWVDKNRAIKSSAHDIEHMIYAAGTDLLVTMDKKFKERSMLIYQRLGISTNVMDWDQYKDYLDSLVNSKSPEHY